jgi:hypothetical protein
MEVLFLKELKLDFVRIRHKKTICMSDGSFDIESIIFSFISFKNVFSKAIVIEGAFGDGAKIFLNHCQKLLFCVVLPKRLFWYRFV